MVQIIKRDGTKVPFDKEKIIVAINKALVEVDGILYETDTATDIAEEIYAIASLFQDRPLTVEDIQNAVEDYLMRSERRDVARSYIRYRYKKEVARNYTNDFINAIKEKLNASDVQNQNANMDESSFGGRTGEASSVVTKQLALDYIVCNKSKENHLNNEIYIHDLDSYYVGSHNCLSIPFDKLLAEGFKTRQTDVRPAGSVNTAFQLLAVIFQLQSLQQFGGVSATHLDWTMVPYVRKSFYKHFIKGLKYCESKTMNILSDELKKKINNTLSIDSELYKAPFTKAYEYAMDQTISEIHQAVEGMYHNLK